MSAEKLDPDLCSHCEPYLVIESVYELDVVCEDCDAIIEHVEREDAPQRFWWPVPAAASGSLRGRDEK